MHITGNIFLGLSALSYLLLLFANSSKPAGSGDNVMGYGLAMAFLGLCLALCTLVLLLILAFNGGFNWISESAGPRLLLVLAGWAGFSATVFFSAIFKWEKVDMIPGMQILAGHAAVWLPLLLLVPCLLLLNEGLRGNAAPLLYKVPLIVAFAVSMLGGLILLRGWFVSASASQMARIEAAQTEDAEMHKRHLEEIAKADPQQSILTLLPFTGRFHDKAVREAALARIKTNPDWETKLLELLDNEHYYHEVYTFIDDNKTAHPERFAEPLQRSIFRLAEDVRKYIRNDDHPQNWHLEHFDIERLLRGLDQFENQGVDYRPAVQAVYDALSEPQPAHLKPVRFNVETDLKNWLRRHK